MQEEEGLDSKQISKRIGLSRSSVDGRISKIDKITKRELAKAILKLISTRKATMDQIFAIGREYGLEEKDFDEIMNSLEER